MQKGGKYLHPVDPKDCVIEALYQSWDQGFAVVNCALDHVTRMTSQQKIFLVVPNNCTSINRYKLLG